MFTFKQKLVLSMMGVITGITLVLLIIAERKLQAAHEARFLREFNSEFALFTARQEAQLASLKAAASELSSGVRLIAILNELARDQDQDTARLVLMPPMGSYSMDLRMIRTKGSMPSSKLLNARSNPGSRPRLAI
jgi:hypothetical protein